MPRFIILGVVLAIAFTLYSLVDASMTEARRARGVPKPVWVVICVLLPVIGGILWLTIGKGDGKEKPAAPRPDDDPRFGSMSDDKVDQRIADLEEQLRALDDEVFPGEQPASDAPTANPDARTESDPSTAPGTDDPRGTDEPEGDEPDRGVTDSADGQGQPSNPDARDDGTER